MCLSFPIPFVSRAAVHSDSPVSDSKMLLPAMVSDSNTQKALTPVDVCRRVKVPSGLASSRSRLTKRLPTKYSAFGAGSW